MKRIGVSLKINMDKVDQERIFKGEKGNYLTLKTFINLNGQDQYGCNGVVKQDAEQNAEMPIIGDVKIFWEGG